MSSTSFNIDNNFNKTYSWLIQDQLDKIKPTSYDELQYTIEALRSLIEPNHQVHESLKDRIENITYLLGDEAAEIYGLKGEEDRKNFKSIVLLRTTQKIQHLVHLTENKEEAVKYFEGIGMEKSKAVKDKSKIEERKLDEMKQEVQAKHVFSTEDWNAWLTYKYEIQSENEWSLSNREIGWNIQKLDKSAIQASLNGTFFTYLLPNSIVFPATFISPEQACELNDDQVYILACETLLKSFCLLLIKGNIPFAQLKELEKERFQMIVDFAPQVLEYLELGVNFNELATLPLTKLLICLYQHPAKLQEVLKLNIKFELIAQIPNSIFAKLLSLNFTSIQQILQHVKISELKDMSIEEFRFLIGNWKSFLKIVDYSGSLKDFFNLDKRYLERMIRFLNECDKKQLKEEFKKEKIKFSTIADFEDEFFDLQDLYSWEYCINYLTLYQQSLATDKKEIQEFLVSQNLTKYFSVEQFLEMTSEEKRSLCLFSLIKPEFHTLELFEALKKNEFLQLLNNLQLYPILKKVILTPDDFIAMLEFNGDEDYLAICQVLSWNKYFQKGELLKNMQLLRQHEIALRRIFVLHSECRYSHDLSFLIQNNKIIKTMSLAALEVFKESYHSGSAGYKPFLNFLVANLRSLENLLSSEKLNLGEMIECFSCRYIPEIEPKINQLQAIFANPEGFRYLLSIWPKEENFTYPLYKYMTYLKLDQFKILLQHSKDLEEAFKHSNSIKKLLERICRLKVNELEEFLQKQQIEKKEGKAV